MHEQTSHVRGPIYGDDFLRRLNRGICRFDALNGVEAELCTKLIADGLVARAGDYICITDAGRNHVSLFAPFPTGYAGAADRAVDHRSGPRRAAEVGWGEPDKGLAPPPAPHGTASTGAALNPRAAFEAALKRLKELGSVGRHSAQVSYRRATAIGALLRWLPPAFFDAEPEVAEELLRVMGGRD